MEHNDRPMKYTYIIGHGFGETEYKAEIIGRFGTSIEAESNIDLINKEVNTKDGCLAFKKEFPFLILEIVNVEFEKDVEKVGIPYKFYTFNWEEIKYVESVHVDKIKVLEEYKEHADMFMKKLDEMEVDE
jgi:hypothetical protein